MKPDSMVQTLDTGTQSPDWMMLAQMEISLGWTDARQFRAAVLTAATKDAVSLPLDRIRH